MSMYYDNEFKNFEYLNSPNGGGITFALMTVAFVLISFFGQAIVGAIFGTANATYTLICSCFPALTFLLVILLFKSYTKKPLLKIVGANKFNWLYVVLAVVVSASMLFGLGFVNDAFVNLLNKWGANIDGVNVPLDNVGQLLVCILTFALLPAVFEEFFFRGLLLNCLKGVKPIYAILTVGLCFALYHCSLAQLLYQFVYGAVLTALAIACVSVIPCIIAHLLNNLTVILLEYFRASINLYNPLYIVFGILALLTVCVFTVFAIKKKKAEQTAKVRGFYAFACVGFFVCLFLTFGSMLNSILGG